MGKFVDNTGATRHAMSKAELSIYISDWKTLLQT